MSQVFHCSTSRRSPNLTIQRTRTYLTTLSTEVKSGRLLSAFGTRRQAWGNNRHFLAKSESCRRVCSDSLRARRRLGESRDLLWIGDRDEIDIFFILLLFRYFLQPRSAKHRPSKISSNSTPPGTIPCIGSLRLKIHYTADHVFPSEMYERLESLLLQSVSVRPITSSAVYILGEIVASKMEAAQPLVRVLVHHEKLVSVMRALASYEISKLT